MSIAEIAIVDQICIVTHQNKMMIKLNCRLTTIGWMLNTDAAVTGDDDGVGDITTFFIRQKLMWGDGCKSVCI